MQHHASLTRHVTNNAPCHSQTVALLFRARFCLPNSRAPLSRPLLPPEQSRSSFTATPESQTVALLSHARFCLPNSRAPLSRSLLPPKQSRSSFTATPESQTVALFHALFCLSNSHAPLSRPLLPHKQSRPSFTFTSLPPKKSHSSSTATSPKTRSPLLIYKTRWQPQAQHQKLAATFVAANPGCRRAARSSALHNLTSAGITFAYNPINSHKASQGAYNASFHCFMSLAIPTLCSPVAAN